MTYEVRIEPPALNAIAQHMEADHPGALALFSFIDALAIDPRPAGSVPWGPEHRRARIGAWRVLYHIDDAVKIVAVANIGRTDSRS